MSYFIYLIPGPSLKKDSKIHSHSTSTSGVHSDSIDSSCMFGLPPPLLAADQLISLSGDKKLLIHSHLLEFSGSLSVMASLPRAMERALSEVVGIMCRDQIEVP